MIARWNEYELRVKGHGDEQVLALYTVINKHAIDDVNLHRFKYSLNQAIDL